MTKIESDPFLEQFIGLAGDVAEMVSFNRSLGQLYGLLYISTEPMSLHEIATTCKMSKGNASIHLRILEDWDAVHRSSQPGTRKDYYTANMDIKSVVSKRFQEGLSKRLNLIRRRLAALKRDPTISERLQNPKNAHWIERMEKAEFMMRRIEKALPLLKQLIGMADV